MWENNDLSASAGPLNEENLVVKLRQNPKIPASSLPVFYGLYRNY